MPWFHESEKKSVDPVVQALRAEGDKMRWDYANSYEGGKALMRQVDKDLEHDPVRAVDTMIYVLRYAHDASFEGEIRRKLRSVAKDDHAMVLDKLERVVADDYAPGIRGLMMDVCIDQLPCKNRAETKAMLDTISTLRDKYNVVKNVDGEYMHQAAAAKLDKTYPNLGAAFLQEWQQKDGCRMQDYVGFERLDSATTQQRVDYYEHIIGKDCPNIAKRLARRMIAEHEDKGCDLRTKSAWGEVAMDIAKWNYGRDAAIADEAKQFAATYSNMTAGDVERSWNAFVAEKSKEPTGLLKSVFSFGPITQYPERENGISKR